jgi:uncharacterized protein
MPPTEFAPWSALFGGAMIGLSAVLMMFGPGRIAGISGITSRLLPPYVDNAFGMRAGFIAGLLAAPLFWRLATGGWPAQTVPTNLAILGLAGLLVGFGTVLGGGCTSGHGVCGLSRLSMRSLVSVIIFMAVAALVVFLQRHVLSV